MSSADSALRAAQQAFSDCFLPAHRGRISVVATDVDGTLTDARGRLTAVGLGALQHLRECATPPTVILVTGRPAAAVQGLLLYTGFGHCPIIAENGAVLVPRPGAAATVLAPYKHLAAPAVEAVLARAGVAARPAEDNADRIADLTFVPDTPGHPTPQALAALAAAVTRAVAAADPALGLPPTQVLYSTVHVHVGPAGIDKGLALRRVLAGEAGALGGPVAETACVVLGDSGNDAALFRAFPAQAVAVPGPGPTLHPALAPLARFAAPAVADAGFAAVMHALFPSV